MSLCERGVNLSYLVPRNPSIKCWNDRVKPEPAWAKNLVQLGLDEYEDIMDDTRLNVHLRLKPSSSNQASYTVLNKTTLQTEAPKESVSYKNVTNGVGKLVHKFTFTSVLDQKATQTTIFENCVLNNLKRFLSGENYLLFAYGTTNAGKTFTMQGTIEQPGVIPRAMSFVFTSLKDNVEMSCRYRHQPNRPDGFCYLNEEEFRRDLAYKTFVLKLDLSKYQRHPETSYMTYKSEVTSQTFCLSDLSENYENITFQKMEQNLRNTEYSEVSRARYAIWISMVEIYNEQVYDLLEMPDEKGNRTILSYGEDGSGNMYVKNLRYVNVSSGHEAFQVLQFGRANLHLAPTALNNKSSRSHCICTITLARFLDNDNPGRSIISRFSFCDLAGTERAKKTLNVGDRLAESKSINTSLLILVKCLTIIKENQNRREKKMIPFRESKLTRLFRDAMTGKEKFSMIVNVTTEPNLFDETLNVLKFSAIAQQIVPKNVFVKPKRVQHLGRSRFSYLVASSRESNRTIDWDTTTIVDDPSGRESNSAFDNLLQLVDRLKKELADEKARCERIEVETREELTSKFSEMLKEQDDFNKARLERETTRLYEKFEKKEKRIIQHYQKLERSAKRRRIEESDTSCDFEEKLKEYEKQLEYMGTENGSLRERVHILAEEVDNLQVRCSEMRFEIAEKDRLLELHERTSQASRVGEDELTKELQSQLTEAQNKIIELKDLLNEAVAEHKELLESNRELKEESETLERELVEVRDLLPDAKSENVELQKLVSDKSDIIEELEGRCEHLREEILVLNEKHGQNVMELESHITELKDEIQLLNRNTAALENLKTEKETLEQNSSGLNLEIETLQSEIKKIIEKTKEKDEENERLEGMLTKLINSGNEMEAKLQDHELVKRGFESEIESLRKKLEAAEYQSSVMKSMKDEAERTAYGVPELKEEIERLRSELDNRQRELIAFTENRQQMFSNYDREISKLKEDNERLRKDVLFGNEVVVRNLTPRKTNPVEVNKLKETIKKKDEEILKLKSELESLSLCDLECLKQTSVQNTKKSESEYLDSCSSKENSPFVDTKKKVIIKAESTPDRLSRRIETLTIANSEQKKSTRKGINLLEESVHPCTVKTKGRGRGRKEKKEKEKEKGKEEEKEKAPKTEKKEQKCKKKLFTENDFDNMIDLESSFVEPEIPRLRPRKN